MTTPSSPETESLPGADLPSGPESGPESDPDSGLAPEPDLKALWLGFASVGISGFGGVLPFVRRMLVEERRWLAAEDFNALLGLCQFLPGPNVINMAVAVGSRYQGIPGAVVSVLGLLGGPFLIVLLLGVLYDQYGELPRVQGMLRGIAAVGCGLLFATALSMGNAIRGKRVFLPFSLLVFVAIAVLRWPLPPVMIVLAVCAACVAYVYRGRRASSR